MLTDTRMLQGFCNRGKSCIGLPGRRKPKHFELLTFLNEKHPKEIEKVIGRLNNLNEEMIVNIIEDIPINIMKDLDKNWVLRLLMYRKDWILNWYERSGEDE